VPSYLHLAYRRNARAASKNYAIKPHKDIDSLKKAREDFGFFCEYVADKPPAQHHKDWHRHFVTEEDSSCLLRIAGPNVDLLAPRGSAKSTVLGLLTAWAIGIHTQAKRPLQILYLSYTVDIARSKSATIKRIIESKRYQEVFPEVRLLKNVTSNEYWSIDHKFAGIDVTGDEQFTLCAAGLKGSVTSKRSHLVMIDDAIKSAADISNPDIRKMMQDNWNAVIAPTMFEGARAICLGTRFRHDDIHATTFNEQNNWTQIVLSAIGNDPKTGDEISYWPEMWSLDYLKEKKRQAPIAFSFQYMNQIIRQNELSLAPELIVKAEISTEFDTLGVGVDLSAGTKEKNDYTVMVLGGRIGDRIHIIDYRRLRVMGNLEKLDALKELLNDWSILGKDANDNYFPTYSTCDIWSEAVQYQASLEADFKRVCLNQESLYNLIWHPVKGFRADKLARFRGIMGMFEDRKIIFNRYRNFTTMFEELTNFGVSSHDDTVDALVWLVTGLARKGPEYIAIGLTAVVSAITGGSWVAGKILGRQNDQIQQAFNYIGSQKRRIDILEDDLKRMPLEYVLKVDFLREIQQMHDNFNQINAKLDKLVEKLLEAK
jgi:hypothetical protein